MRERFNGSSSNAKGSKSKKKSKSSDCVDGQQVCKEAMEFSIEYAKSGRAKCRQCEDKIEKVVMISFQSFFFFGCTHCIQSRE